MPARPTDRCCPDGLLGRSSGSLCTGFVMLQTILLYRADAQLGREILFARPIGAEIIYSIVGRFVKL